MRQQGSSTIDRDIVTGAGPRPAGCPYTRATPGGSGVTG